MEQVFIEVGKWNTVMTLLIDGRLFIMAFLSICLTNEYLVLSL